MEEKWLRSSGAGVNIVVDLLILIVSHVNM